MLSITKKKNGQKEIDGDIKKIYKKSFTIKEIHPEHRYNTGKDSLLSDPEYGKYFGSYFQIINLQKNYDKANSPERTRFLKGLNPITTKSRFENRKNRFPSKFTKVELQEGNTFDLDII